MPITEIRREKWSSFFKSFWYVHDGWLIDLKEMDNMGHALVIVHGQPLGRIEVSENAIQFWYGHHDESYVIDQPVMVKLRQSDQGADEELEVRSSDKVVILNFRTVIRPEFVDGVLP